MNFNDFGEKKVIFLQIGVQNHRNLTPIIVIGGWLVVGISHL